MSYPARAEGLVNSINKKKRTGKIVVFAVPADHRVKLKESEKKEKYLEFARELKETVEHKSGFIPIITDALGAVTKGLIQILEDLEIRGRVEIIQTTALLIL